ncbi:MAG: BsuPI-related putative proteinase inhibitor [Candidatus Bathyarchaeota archaeon]|nr:BsuPI-related putative proteinase inhibitor [Candidatus Bathyarchaeota archaeon]
MTKKFSARSPLHLVIAATIVFMCLDTFLPLNFSSVEAEATAYPFQLKITLEKTTYQLGEPVSVTWILTNIGDENVTLYFPRDLLLDFIIRDKDFNHVFRYRTYNGVLCVILTLPPLMPGDNMTYTGDWRQIYDGYPGRNIYDLPPYYRLGGENVPSGIYYVSGVFHSAAYDFELETSAIRIIIG